MHLEFTAIPLRLLAPCTGSVALLDSQQMIYISGRVVVIYNWTYQTQTFLPPRNSTLATSAFCLSPDWYFFYNYFYLFFYEQNYYLIILVRCWPH